MYADESAEHFRRIKKLEGPGRHRALQ